MAENTKIEWCDYTFNPWIGCQKVSPGCEHRYADVLLQLANRPCSESPGVCRVCGCTDDKACLDENGEPCWWVQEDLCSHCVTAFAS